MLIELPQAKVLGDDKPSINHSSCNNEAPLLRPQTCGNKCIRWCHSYRLGLMITCGMAFIFGFMLGIVLYTKISNDTSCKNWDCDDPIYPNTTSPCIVIPCQFPSEDPQLYWWCCTAALGNQIQQTCSSFQAYDNCESWFNGSSMSEVRDISIPFSICALIFIITGVSLIIVKCHNVGIDE